MKGPWVLGVVAILVGSLLQVPPAAAIAGSLLLPAKAGQEIPQAVLIGDLLAGATIGYDFSTDPAALPANFSLHVHIGSNVFPLLRRLTNHTSDTLQVTQAGTYLFFWSNPNPQPIKVTYNFDVTGPPREPVGPLVYAAAGGLVAIFAGALLLLLWPRIRGRKD